MKITCNVIKDLLPLYYDHMCSEETKQIVEEHLKSCESCRKELAYLSGDFTFNANINEEKIRTNASKAVKKIRNKNIILGFVAAVCVLAIVFILGLLADSLFKRTSTTIENSKYKYTLTAGIYEVGAHIPIGTYKVKVVNEDEGYFSLHESPDLYFSTLNVYKITNNDNSKDDTIEKVGAGFGLRFGGYAGPMFGAKAKVKEVDVEEGQFINVKADTTLIFYSNEISNSDLNLIHIDNSEAYYVSEHEYHFIESNAVAGIDFPVGVYDILYKPVQEENSGSVECKLNLNDYEGSFLFECDGEDGEQIVFRGIPFTQNSSITTNYLDEIYLVPSEDIGPIFNDITWDSQK